MLFCLVKRIFFVLPVLEDNTTLYHFHIQIAFKTKPTIQYILGLFYVNWVNEGTSGKWCNEALELHNCASLVQNPSYYMEFWEWAKGLPAASTYTQMPNLMSRGHNL